MTAPGPGWYRCKSRRLIWRFHKGLQIQDGIQGWLLIRQLIQTGWKWWWLVHCASNFFLSLVFDQIQSPTSHIARTLRKQTPLRMSRAQANLALQHLEAFQQWAARADHCTLRPVHNDHYLFFLKTCTCTTDWDCRPLRKMGNCKIEGMWHLMAST